MIMKSHDELLMRGYKGMTHNKRSGWLKLGQLDFCKGL